MRRVRITAAMNNPDCLFCKIVQRKLPATLRFEDDEMMAFDDIHPKAPVHVLLIPKDHLTSLNAVDDDPAVVGRLILRLRVLAKDLGVSETGYRIVVNTGQGGGQLIDHLHLHLLGGGKLQLGNFI